MNLGALGIEVIIQDAYSWLAKNERKFDVVFDDIYLAGKTDVFRPKAWDPTLMRHLKNAVAPDGLLAVNLITGQGHRAMQSLTRKMLKTNFPVVRSLRTEDGMNEVLVAGNAIASRRHLDNYLALFKDWRDRMFWNRITLRLLSSI
jgi:spermidine synthase